VTDAIPTHRSAFSTSLVQRFTNMMLLAVEWRRTHYSEASSAPTIRDGRTQTPQTTPTRNSQDNPPSSTPSISTVSDITTPVELSPGTGHHIPQSSTAYPRIFLAAPPKGRPFPPGVGRGDNPPSPPPSAHKPIHTPTTARPVAKPAPAPTPTPKPYKLSSPVPSLSPPISLSPPVSISNIPSIPSLPPTPKRQISPPRVPESSHSPNSKVRFTSSEKGKGKAAPPRTRWFHFGREDVTSPSTTTTNTSSSSTSQLTPTRTLFDGMLSSEFTNASVARTMFFVGFIFPWCWLIGGWLLPLLSPSPICAPSPDRIRARIAKSEPDPDRVAREPKPVPSRIFDSLMGRFGLGKGLPTHFDANKRSYAMTISPKQKAQTGKWVKRCRIAAMAGLVVLLVLIAVAIWAATAR
jgi:hypothetical protein